MNAVEAARNLELIRTLMERTTQYQLLTARAGLAAGCLAGAGAVSFLALDPSNPWQFGAVWAAVFAGSVLALLGTAWLRARESRQRFWSRQARMVVLALLPAVFTALVLSVFFFAGGQHLWLPGVWMLCYGQGALATAAYAPAPIRGLGLVTLALGTLTLTLGPDWAVPMMGMGFGAGHIGLGLALLQRRRAGLRLYREVA
jgi:hypothetical protein